jgi:hypothetical protein
MQAIRCSGQSAGNYGSYCMSNRSPLSYFFFQVLMHHIFVLLKKKKPSSIVNPTHTLKRGKSAAFQHQILGKIA